MYTDRHTKDGHNNSIVAINIIISLCSSATQAYLILTSNHFSKLELWNSTVCITDNEENFNIKPYTEKSIDVPAQTGVTKVGLLK